MVCIDIFAVYTVGGFSSTLWIFTVNMTSVEMGVVVIFWVCCVIVNTVWALELTFSIKFRLNQSHIFTYLLIDFCFYLFAFTMFSFLS